ncbi:uncharacterized protein F5891DRAFT_985704 [Suillus fuscotomentosus]|uniref:Uncharacterized protein n=1 Tax=Suillus fuscotomentosus TaxID=1912939 RepID=A0AAD4DTV2_9AGAM|nr:uncharacterized protein F5891DRAFT_985704 [Suillus fuscotomentosus]KAG1893647.1 hypothetical protein F5891DRAFT_985704 [Suillus fuscotomentosus]
MAKLGQDDADSTDSRDGTDGADGPFQISAPVHPENAEDIKLRPNRDIPLRRDNQLDDEGKHLFALDSILYLRSTSMNNHNNANGGGGGGDPNGGANHPEFMYVSWAAARTRVRQQVYHPDLPFVPYPPAPVWPENTWAMMVLWIARERRMFELEMLELEYILGLRVVTRNLQQKKTDRRPTAAPRDAIVGTVRFLPSGTPHRQIQYLDKVTRVIASVVREDSDSRYLSQGMAECLLFPIQWLSLLRDRALVPDQYEIVAHVQVFAINMSSVPEFRAIALKRSGTVFFILPLSKYESIWINGVDVNASHTLKCTDLSEHHVCPAMTIGRSRAGFPPRTASWKSSQLRFGLSSNTLDALEPPLSGLQYG